MYASICSASLVCVYVRAQVRETLHASAVEQKRRQLRSLEGQMAAKRNENATLALHMAGKGGCLCCDVLIQTAG